MKIISSLKSILEKGFKRFLFPLIWLFLTFASTVCLIFELPDEFFAYFTLSLVLSVFLSLFCVLLSERFKHKRLFYFCLQAIPLVSAVLFYFLLKSEDLYCALAYIGLLVSAIIACIILLFGENNRHTLIPHIIKSIVMSNLLAVIVFGGLMICLAAVNYLIVELDIFDKLTLTVVSLSFIAVFGGFFICSLPEFNSELSIPKAFRVIFLYAAFPIYILLLAVLYIYFGKIIVTWSIPGGQLNWFASFAEVFFILFHFTILQYDNRITSLWKKIGGYLILPVILFQAIAIYIRISAYGLTTSRWVSILLSLVATVFVILSLIKEGKYRNASLYVLLGVILISTLTPLSFIDVPVLEQNARFESLLLHNGMKKGDAIVANADIPDEEKDAILSSFDYLRYSDSRFVPEYIKDINVAELKDIFGFDEDTQRIDYTYISYHSNDYGEKVIDTSKYSGFIEVNNGYDGSFAVYILGKEYDLTDKLGNYETSPEGSYICVSCDDVDFYISHLTYSYYEKEGKKIYRYVSLSGYAFLY